VAFAIDVPEGAMLLHEPTPKVVHLGVARIVRPISAPLSSISVSRPPSFASALARGWKSSFGSAATKLSQKQVVGVDGDGKSAELRDD
jgi:hypothetical protein